MYSSAGRPLRSASLIVLVALISSQVVVDRWEFATSAHFSTVPDVARFISLQLRAGSPTIAPIAGGTLLEMQTPQRLQNNWNDAIGIGWWIEPNQQIGDIVWHKGGSKGFGSYVAFSSRYKVGVVLFTNRNRSLEEIGRWLLVRAALDIGLPEEVTRLRQADVRHPESRFHRELH